jgi:hypothetical protein
MKVVRSSALRIGHLYLQECSWYLFSIGAVSTPGSMLRSEGNTSLKNSVTPQGIDPGTVRLVAQHLNHYATPGPYLKKISRENSRFNKIQWQPSCSMWTDGRTDGRTDMTKLIVDFRNFAKAPTNFNFSMGLNNQSTKVLWLLKLQVQGWLQLWQDHVRMSDLPTVHLFLTQYQRIKRLSDFL